MARTAIGLIGDVNYTEHGGMIVFSDGTVDLIEIDEGDNVSIYRFTVDKVEQPSTEWYGKDLGKVAKFADVELVDLAAGLNSEDVLARAFAYSELAAYHGAANFDDRPLQMTMKEAERRYKTAGRALARRFKTNRRRR